MTKLQLFLIRIIILIQIIIVGFIGYYIYLVYNNWQLEKSIEYILKG